MAFPEGLLQRRIGLLPRIGMRKTPDLSVPLTARPELQVKGKGYLYLTTAHAPDNPTQASALGTLPEMLKIKALDVNPKDPNLTDFIIWDPTAVDVQITSFSRLSNSVEVQERIRGDYLWKHGYKDIKRHTYPDRLVQVAIRKPARLAATLSSPAVDTSEPILQP